MKSCMKKFTGILTVALLVMGITACKVEAEHEHTWDSGVVTTAATCLTKGVKTYTCSICGETKTEEIAALGWCETVIDAETFDSATSSSTYVYFGVFPKTVAYQDDAGKLYAADKTTEITIDETTSVPMGGNTYYKGSDGEYYAKVTENGYNSSYTYNDGTTVQKSSANSTRYFKMEPIKWKVLTTDYNSTGKALLLAEEILTANVPYYVSISKRNIGESTVYANNYKYSTIRAYLNGSYESDDTQTTTYNNKGFLQTAFTTAAQSLIATTTVVNNGLSTTDAAKNFTRADGYKADGTTSSGCTDYTCADTQDKIFLLSEQEATTTAYGFAGYKVYKGDSNGTTESSRIRVTTDYAKANYAYQDSTAGYGGLWWLRSPFYCVEYGACRVGYEGHAAFGNRIFYTFYGVVPALSISF